MDIIIIILLGVCFVLQVYYLIVKKDVSDLYLTNKLSLTDQHYVEHRITNGRLNVILVDSKNGEEYVVSKVYEKGLNIYFVTEDYSYRYSSLRKNVRACKV